MRSFKVRKKVMAVVFAVLAFALIAASAATLGGINASNVGADTDVVAACNGGAGGVTVTWDSTAYNSGTNGYDVTAFTVAGLGANCDGEPIQVTLAAGDGTSLASVSGTVVGGSASFSGINANAEQLRRVAVVVG
jgi:hypothetical protein